MEFLDPTLIYEGKMYMSLSFACCLLKGNMEISVVFYTLWMNLNTEISMFRLHLIHERNEKISCSFPFFVGKEHGNFHVLFTCYV